MGSVDPFLALSAGEGTPVALGPSSMVIKVAGEDTGGAYAVVEYLAAPESGAGLHRHHNEDETFFILEGEMTFQLGDEIMVAGPGALVRIPRMQRHAFSNNGDASVRALIMFAPGGLERYFVELSDLLQDPGGVTLEDVQRLNAKYHLEFEG